MLFSRRLFWEMECSFFRKSMVSLVLITSGVRVESRYPVMLPMLETVVAGFVYLGRR